MNTRFETLPFFDVKKFSQFLKHLHMYDMHT